MPEIFQRLKQRKLIQWCVAYLAGAWVLLQVLDFVAGQFDWPSALVRSATVFLAMGFFAALVLAWYHGERGQQRVVRNEVLLLAMILIAAISTTAVTYRSDSAETPAKSAIPDGGGAITTVAVVPFENISGNPQDEYFSDGMTDELAHALGQLPALRVAGRTSSYAFKGKAVAAQEIGKALAVSGVIAGTVRRSGDRLRVMAQLADAADGKVIWTHTYESSQTDVFVVQDSFTQAIVSALLPHLRGDAAAAAAEEGRGTTDQEAYDLYLRGRFYFARRGPENLDRAADYFQRAVAKDPNFARAHASLAMTYGVLPAYRPDPENTLQPLVQRSAQRALSLDAKLPDAHLALALAYDRDLRFPEAEAEYRAATVIDPSSSTAHHWLGETLLSIGRVDEAIAEITRATELDPLSPVMNNSRGAALVMARRFAESIPWSLRSLELDPNLAWGSVNLAHAYTFLGHGDSAVAALEPVYRRDPSAQGVAATLVLAYAAAGQWSDAQHLRSELNRPGGDSSGGVQAAYAELVFGNREPLLKLFDTTGGQRRIYDTLGWFGCNPLLDPLTGEPRFLAAMRNLRIERCSLTSPWPVRRSPQRTQ